MNRRIIASMVALGWTIGAQAAIVTLEEGDTESGDKSYSSAGNWSDKQPPHAGADYFVALGGDVKGESARGVMTSNYGKAGTKEFGGDSMTLGELGESGLGGLFQFRASKVCSTYFKNLNLKKGCYWVNCSADQTGIDGKITVYSPESDPFSFIGTATEKKLEITAEISGAAGTCLQVRSSAYVDADSGSLEVDIKGDNHAYLGSFKATNPKNRLKFVGANAIGASPNYSVVLADRGILLCDDTATVYDASKKIWIEQTGGSLEVPATKAGACAMTVAGEGPVAKIGGGKLTFSGTVDGIDLEVKEGELAWGAQASLTNDARLVVRSGGFVSATAELARTDFKAMGGVMVHRDAAGQTTPVTLAGTCTIEGPIVLALDGAYPLEGGAESYPVVRIPKSLKTVVKNDFVIDGSAYATEDDTLGVVVATDGEMQTVSIRRKGQPVKLVVTKSNSSNAVTVGSVWDDGQPAQAGKDYLVYADMATRVVRSGLDSQATETFQGDSLTLMGTAESNYWARFYVSTLKLIINDLTMKPYSDIVTGSAKTGGSITRYEIDGNILIDASRTDGGARISDVVGNTISLGARLYGGSDALLKMTPYENKTGVYKLELLGDNSAYLGSIHLEQAANASLASYQELLIEDERNLGGNPTEFTVEALKLNNYGRLTALRSLVIDDPNRGLYVNENGQIAVTNENDTLTILSDLTIYGGSLHKVGPGTLKLGGTMRFGSKGTATEPGNKASRAIIEVREGALQLTKGEMCSKVQLKVSEGGCIRIAPQAEDADEVLKTKGLVVHEYTDGRDHIVPAEEGGKVNFDLVYDASTITGSFTMPLVTVPASLADTLRDKINVTTSPVRRHGVSVVERTVGDNVVFAAHYSAGLKVSLK